MKTDRKIPDMTAAELDELRLVNQDATPTGYPVPRLSEVLAYLKDKVYINVDKFWTDVKGISEEIRRAGVEKQVIVKTGVEEEALAEVRAWARDFMFMPIVRATDTVSERLLEQGVNLVGTEILFKTEADEVISDAYISRMHQKGLIVWANAIVYNERAVISAYHTDDAALKGDPDFGWGWLVDKGVDLIQTDWLLMLKQYLMTRGNKQ